MSGVQKGAQRASGDAPADGAAARNAQWRGGAAGATGVVCAEQRLYSFSWKLLINVIVLVGQFFSQARVAQIDFPFVEGWQVFPFDHVGRQGEGVDNQSERGDSSEASPQTNCRVGTTCLKKRSGVSKTGY